MNCSACSKENVVGSKFCAGCGVALIPTVPPKGKTPIGLYLFFLSVIAFLAVVWSIGTKLPNRSEKTAQPGRPEAPYLAGNGLGAPAPPASYTREQRKVVFALYQGKMDGPVRFQVHCGNANFTYVREIGPWAGATTLMYSSNQAGQNPSGSKDDVSVLIGLRKNLPPWLASIYGQGKENGKYAIKVYLGRPGSHSNDENGYMPDQIPLDAGRAVILLGCHADETPK